MIGATMFSGIGAPEVAMPHWRWAWHAEIEKFPSAVLACRQPHSINLGDVSADGFSTRAKAIASPRVLVFGSPCQSFSIAGKRLGLDDPRGNLALVALALVSELRPEWFVFENVPGLLSSDSGRDFGAFLGTVGQLGYGWTYRVFDAQFFGVPQRRRRVFVVGNLRDWRRSAAILFEPKSLRRDSAPRRQAGQGTAEPIGASAAFNNTGQGYWNDAGSAQSVRKGDDNGGGGARESTLVAHTLNAKGGVGRQDYESETLIPMQRGGSFDPVCFSAKDYGGDAGSLAPTLRSGNHSKSHANGGCMPAISIALRGREGGGTAEIGGDQANALRASQGGGDKPHVLTSAVRRLTPRECERLQGFPDDYTAISVRGKPAADGPRYKAIGNSMAVPVLRWILSRIELFDQLKVAA